MEFRYSVLKYDEKRVVSEESVDKTKIEDFVKTDVLRGDFQQNFSIKEVDFIVGGDFSVSDQKVEEIS